MKRAIKTQAMRKRSMLGPSIRSMAIVFAVLIQTFCVNKVLGKAESFDVLDRFEHDVVQYKKQGAHTGSFRMHVQRHHSPKQDVGFSWYDFTIELFYKVILYAFKPRYAIVGCCRVPGVANSKDNVCEHVSSRVYVQRLGGEAWGHNSRTKHESWCGIKYYLGLYEVLANRARQGLQEKSNQQKRVMIPWCHVLLPVYASDDMLIEITPRGRIQGEWMMITFKASNQTLVMNHQTEKIMTEGVKKLEEVITYHLSQRDSNTGGICALQEVQSFSLVRSTIFVAGAILVMFSHVIASSTACRLVGGSVTFVAMSGIVLAYIVWRQVPHRKSIVAMITLWSGAAIFICKTMLFGSPGGEPALLPSLMKNPLLIAYLLISGLLGMAVTYYFNDNRNEKLNTILKVGLQIVGCICMFMSPTSIEAGVILTILVCGAIYIHQKSWHSKQAKPISMKTPYPLDIPNDPLFDVAASPEWQKTSGKHHPDEINTPCTPTVFRASTVAVPPSPKDFPDKSQLHSLVQRGKILNMETDRTIAIGKGTYNALFLQGYEVDFEKGTITPPGKHLASQKKFT